MQWFWAFVAMLFLILCAARASTVVLDDDNIWLAYLGIPPAANAKTIEREMVQRTAGNPACSDESFRLSLRDRYVTNYIGYSTLDLAVYRTMTVVGEKNDTAVIRASIVTKILLFTCLAAFLILIAAQLRNRTLSLAVAAALTGMAGLDWAIHTGALPSVWLADVGDPIKAASRLSYNFVFASEGHSLFGLTPRNAALLLFAAAMILRWDRRPLAASFAILFIGALHQTYGILAVVMFTAAAAVSRPVSLKEVPVQLVLIGALLMAVLRDRLFAAGTVAKWALPVVLLCLVAAAFACIQRHGYQNFRRRLLGRFEGEEVTIDAVVMMLISLSATIAALIFGPHSQPSTRLYFWSDLAIRIWSFGRFPFFVAAALLFLRLLRSRDLPVAIGLAGAASLLCFLTLFQINRSPEWARRAPLDSGLLAIDKPVLELPADEGTLYAHLIAVSIGTEAAAAVERRLSTLPIRCTAMRI